MPREDVELHRRLVEPYSARDMQAGLALSDPQRAGLDT
jgi:hypothetical protein